MLLLDLGVQPGEPVAYQLPNRGEFVAITLAALRIGAVCCPLMPIFRQREIAFMLARSQARVLVVPAELPRPRSRRPRPPRCWPRPTTRRWTTSWCWIARETERF